MTLTDSIKSHKVAFPSLQEGAGRDRLIISNEGHWGQHHSQKNIEKLLSSYQLSTGDLSNWWSHYSSWSWHYELPVVQTYVRHSLLRYTVQEALSMWTLLWRINIQEYVYSRITPLNLLLFESLLGRQQRCRFAEDETVLHLLSQTLTKLKQEQHYYPGWKPYSTKAVKS